MNITEIRQQITALAELRAQRALLRPQMIDRMCEVVMTYTPTIPETLTDDTPARICASIREIASSSHMEGLRLGGEIKKLEKIIRAAVVEHGASVRCAGLLVSYNSGRRSWDSTGLKAKAKEDETLWELYRQGSPSASIKADTKT